MKLTKMIRNNGPAVVVGTLATAPAFATLDTTAATTAITGAVTDVETVAGAVIAAAAVLVW
jgi:hypothetical protein